jgi:hypothetical protein
LVFFDLACFSEIDTPWCVCVAASSLQAEEIQLCRSECSSPPSQVEAAKARWDKEEEEEKEESAGEGESMPPPTSRDGCGIAQEEEPKSR